jgi:cadmium resistance protein CadD (predicted permease)
VAAVTIASGADNLGIYIPLFATQSRQATAVMGAVFVLMTALWCSLAHWLVRHPALGATIRRYGHRVMPYTLIGLGLFILAHSEGWRLLVPSTQGAFTH